MKRRSSSWSRRLRTEGFVCTPLAMHGGGAPPLVVRDRAEITLEVHPGHSGFYLSSDGSPVETEAQRFAITSEPAYATLVALDESRTGLPRLRARGLLSDSPRLIGRDQIGCELEASPAPPTSRRPHAGKSLERPVGCPTARWPAVDLPAGHLA